MKLRVLAIETSCDETAVAIVNQDYHILGQTVSRQLEHEPFGGVVPELAARRHYELLPMALNKTFDNAGIELRDIDLIAVTRGPGLIGALLVGVSYAKGLAYAWKKPLLGVHHIEGHIQSVRLVRKDWPLPALVLIVSGGHTHLYYMKTWGDYRIIARTRDDAIGEAYDKVAKMLELGYPGGPLIDRLAQIGNPAAFSLPIPTMSDETLDFSYSGLKTAVLHIIRKNPEAFLPDESGQPSSATQDLAASFQKAAVAQIMDRLEKIVHQFPARTLIVAGGVAANSLLRSTVEAFTEDHHLTLAIPPIELCTDNAAMIAAVAVSRALTHPDSLEYVPECIVRMDAESNWQLGEPLTL